MRRLGLIHLLTPVGILALAAQVSAAPIPPGGFNSTFDSEANCPGSCGASCSFTDVAWSNVGGDDTDWTIDNNGTTSFNTGPSGDHTTGSGKYLYVEASACNPANEAYLDSVDLDLEADHSYELRFWYHIYGDDLGSIAVDIDPDGSMGALPFADGVQTLSDNLDLWQQARVDLSPFAVGQAATITIRLRGITGTDFASDVAIDDVQIVELYDNDVGVTSVDSPSGVGCNLGQETVTVTVANFGALEQSNFPVEYRLDGGDPVIEMFTGTLASGATASFTFATPVDVSAPGQRVVQVYTALAVDEAPVNDSADGGVLSGERRSAFPYLDQLEADSSTPWEAGGIASSWELAEPASTIIDTAFSGVRAWVTDASGTHNTNEDSYVQSLCGYDFSGMSNPVIRMAVWWEAENSFDGANLQSSTDGGNNWFNVGVNGDPYNWYNDDTINAAPGGSQEGWTGRNGSGSNGWVQAVHALDGLAGQSDVRLRVTFASDFAVNDEGFAFDDIEIFDDVSSLQLEGLGPHPTISARPIGGTDVLLLAAWAESLGQDQTIDSATITLDGSLPETDIVAVRLWIDDGDLSFDPASDIQIGVDQVFVGGSTTFPIGLSSPKWVRQGMFVSVDIDAGGATGTTLGGRVGGTMDIAVQGGAPVVFRNALIGAEQAIFGLVDTLPWTDEIGDAPAVNRTAQFAAGEYPRALGAGTQVANGTTGDDAVVELADDRLLAPNSAPYMGGIRFPNGDAAGAIDYAFDLSEYVVADDLLWLRFQWNNTGQGPSDFNNAFVSNDGGATWNASLYHFDFSAPVAQGWNQETVDVTAALQQAGVDFTDNMRIRFQAGGDQDAPNDGLQVDDIWLGAPQETSLSRDAAPIAEAGTDDLGDLASNTVSLTYTLENTGHLPLDVDVASFSFANENNVSNVVITAPSNNVIDAGASETFDVQFEVNVQGAFSVDISFENDDPRLQAGSFSYVISGQGPEPTLGLSRSGSPVVSGGSDNPGDIAAQELQTLTYTLENTGAGNLDIGAIGISGQGNVTAAVSTPPGVTTLAAGETTTFEVEFTADDTGTYVFDVAVASNDLAGPYTFTVSGAATLTEPPVDGSGCCSTGSDEMPLGNLLLALFIGLVLLRPRKRELA